MKKCVMTVLLIVVLCGCTQPEQKGHYEKLTETVNKSIDAQQVSTDEIITAVEESKLVSAEKLEKVKEVVATGNEKLDIMQDAALKAAKTFDEKAAEDKIAASIEAARTFNVATSPLNPYAPFIEAVLGIAAATATGYAVYKRKEVKTAGEMLYEKEQEREIVAKKYTAHRRGVEAAMRENTSVSPFDLYNKIGAERKALGL